MKFFMAIVVYLLMGLMLGLGVLLTVKGNPWLLITGLGLYLVLLGTIGCLPPKTSH